MKAGIKAAIVATTAAASLVAVSPMAFAGDYRGDHDGRGHHSHHDGDDDDSGGHDGRDNDGDRTSCSQDNSADHGRSGRGGGLINVSDVNVQVPVQACGNDILSGVLGIVAKDQENHSSP